MRASKVASMMYTETGSRRESYADAVLRAFRRTCEEIERALDNVFRVQRLAPRRSRTTRAHGRVRPLSAAPQRLHHRRRPPDRPAPIPMYVDAILGDEFVSAITPMIGDRYIVVVAIDGFPSDSHSGILNILDQLAIPYRWSTRFIFLDNLDAQKLLPRCGANGCSKRARSWIRCSIPTAAWSTKMPSPWPARPKRRALKRFEPGHLRLLHPQHHPPQHRLAGGGVQRPSRPQRAAADRLLGPH